MQRTKTFPIIFKCQCGNEALEEFEVSGIKGKHAVVIMCLECESRIILENGNEHIDRIMNGEV